MARTRPQSCGCPAPRRGAISAARRELAVITGDPEARGRLAAELSAGRVARAEVRGGELWSSARA